MDRIKVFDLLEDGGINALSNTLSRLDDNLFEIICFGGEIILKDPVKSWPIVDAIMSFPLSKVEEHTKLHKPYALNDLEMQRTLMDRRKVHDLLQDSCVDVPRHVRMNRYGNVSHGSSSGAEGNETRCYQVNPPRLINALLNETARRFYCK